MKRRRHESSKYSSTVDFAGFDGLGNVRTTTEQGGAFGGTGWSRESFTGFNPKPLDSGYPTYALGRDPETDEVRWGLDQPWVISTFDARIENRPVVQVSTSQKPVAQL